MKNLAVFCALCEVVSVFIYRLIVQKKTHHSVTTLHDRDGALFLWLQKTIGVATPIKELIQLITSHQFQENFPAKLLCK